MRKIHHKFFAYKLDIVPRRRISRTGATVREFGYYEIGVKNSNLISVERKPNARATVEKRILLAGNRGIYP